MEALRERVEADRDLRKALRTPLMLRLATLTFAGRSHEEIPQVGEPSGLVVSSVAGLCNTYAGAASVDRSR